MRNTEWFHQKKWGVFVHYLYGSVNGKKAIRSMGLSTSWDECISDFNCDAFAAKLHELGAGYMMLTLQQGNKYLCAPNESFDRITGYKPGEACSKTDFVLKMLNALELYGIDLFLYFTGDGPLMDKKAGQAMGYVGKGAKVYEYFVKRWASVMKEYSRRYGTRIKGWWIDGMYGAIGYDDEELIKIMTDAARAGNPDALVACNYYGCTDDYGCVIKQTRRGTRYCDYTSGEMIYLTDIPYGPLICAKQRWHNLTFLGNPVNEYDFTGWGAPGCRYSGEFLKEYIEKVHEKGGVVTLDICAYRDGHIDPQQLEALSHIMSP